MLLKGVEKYGSLSQAAKELNMSYNKAHKLIKKVEDRIGFKLLKTKTGGTGGGFSQVTDEAKELIKKYENFHSECDLILNELFKKHFEKE